MKMLMLVSAVVLLVSPAVASRTHKLDENLSSIFDLADKFNKSLTQEFFVQDVSHLAEGTDKCGDRFFCKVYDILHHHFIKRKEEKALMRNLKIYIDFRNSNCTKLLKNVTSTGVNRPIPELLGYLTQCIQSRNLNSTGSNP